MAKKRIKRQSSKKKRIKRQSMKKRKEMTLKKLRSFGGVLYNQLNKGEFPWIEMPSRSTSNILYDDRLKQYILGKKHVKRSSRNIRHIRPVTQLVWTASFAYTLNKQGKTSTLRESTRIRQYYH
jgi:DNA topoisomerase-6 subunit A